MANLNNNHPLVVAIDLEHYGTIVDFHGSGELDIHQWKDMLIQQSVIECYADNLLIQEYSNAGNRVFASDLDIYSSNIMSNHPVATINLREDIFNGRGEASKVARELFNTFLGKSPALDDFVKVCDLNKEVFFKDSGCTIMDNWVNGVHKDARESWMKIGAMFLMEDSIRLQKASNELNWLDYSLCQAGDPFYTKYGITMDMINRSIDLKCNELEMGLEDDSAYRMAVNEMNDFRVNTLSQIAYNADFLAAAQTNDFSSICKLHEQGYVPSTELLSSLREHGISPNTVIAIRNVFDIKFQSETLNDLSLVNDTDKQHVNANNISQSLN
ncbi:MAG: hypothetical protein PEPC_01698 [Peptostreptococcus russellii]